VASGQDQLVLIKGLLARAAYEIEVLAGFVDQPPPLQSKKKTLDARRVMALTGLGMAELSALADMSDDDFAAYLHEKQSIPRTSDRSEAA
jgi:hypothetical protein